MSVLLRVTLQVTVDDEDKAWSYRHYSVSLFTSGLSCLKRNKMGFSYIRQFFAFLHFNFLRSLQYINFSRHLCVQTAQDRSNSLYVQHTKCVWIESLLSFLSEYLFHSERSRLFFSLFLWSFLFCDVITAVGKFCFPCYPDLTEDRLSLLSLVTVNRGMQWGYFNITSVSCFFFFFF